MVSDRTRQQIEQFERALGKLQAALEVDETEIVRDAMIQRFEFSFEMAWRSAWRWLLDQGEKLPEKAYDVLPSAFQGRLIADADLWVRMRDYRNQTSHTYKEELAVEVAAFIRSSAAGAMAELLAELKRRL